jgi:hypothetical protein
MVGMIRQFIMGMLDARCPVCYDRTEVLEQEIDREIYSIGEIVLASRAALTHLEELTGQSAGVDAGSVGAAGLY